MAGRVASPSTTESSAPAAKRQKTAPKSGAAALPFAAGLLDPSNISKLRAEHEQSTPYKHAVVQQLFEPDFLKAARSEIVEQLSFREKETDIYRINQTGDLSNLSGLPAAELALLPTLLKLRDALYSPEFRSFLQSVTGCGPLSGSKTDMSCAEYNEGCYLLNHDDVIGTRRISFILYLPLEEPAWRPEWGGALELYPVLEADDDNPDRPNVPHSKPTKSIPPSFNQFAFFQVQPGHSFHSVEEVVVQSDGHKGGRGSRVSLSGWFHKPVEGEEGYEGDETAEQKAPKSSLQQLYATTLVPPVRYDAGPQQQSFALELDQADMDALSPFINPAYLKPATQAKLRPQFAEESHVLLSNFLRPEVASELEKLVRAADDEMELKRRGELVAGRVVNRIPTHDAGEQDGWSLVGPAHIQRFCSLKFAPYDWSNGAQSSTQPTTTSASRLDKLLRELAVLVTTPAFRRLLMTFTNMLPESFIVDARRFRPGLDYTLARGEPEHVVDDNGDSNGEGVSKLDVGLGLTPVPKDERDEELWDEGQCGGWEMWLASEEGGDEATYGAGGGGGGAGKQGKDEENGGAHEDVAEEQDQEEENKEEAEEDDDDDNGPLLAFRPSWNTLSIVLRDPGVLKFVKYLNAKAPGSRWDISGEFDVAAVEEEVEEDHE